MRDDFSTINKGAECLNDVLFAPVGRHEWCHLRAFVPFANGWGVSIMAGHYVMSQDDGKYYETAVFEPNGTMQDPCGAQTAKDVDDLIKQVLGYPRGVSEAVLLAGAQNA